MVYLQFSNVLVFTKVGIELKGPTEVCLLVIPYHIKFSKMTGTQSSSYLFFKCIAGNRINQGLCIVSTSITCTSYSHGVLMYM